MGPEPTPKTFGRYLLVERLAEGGMGQVYRAVLRTSGGFEKQLAIKRMLKEFGQDSQFVARFADEAKIASTLNHSNIVQVFDFGEVEGEYYLAMEYVDGPDLGALLSRCAELETPLPTATALWIAAGLARGLGTAHLRRGPDGSLAPVVHRDISPQNVLLCRDGEVKVTDFGIAKAAGNAYRTRTGIVLGKCRYMAPEQAMGGVVDVRADIFAVGCVLFEMLAGRPALEGSGPEEIIRKLVGAPVPCLALHRPDLPPELSALVDRLLHRDPAQRIANGSELAQLLEIQLQRIAPDFRRESVAAFIAQACEVPNAASRAQTEPAGLDPARETLAEDGLALALTETASATSTEQQPRKTRTFASDALEEEHRLTPSGAQPDAPGAAAGRASRGTPSGATAIGVGEATPGPGLPHGVVIEPELQFSIADLSTRVPRGAVDLAFGPETLPSLPTASAGRSRLALYLVLGTVALVGGLSAGWLLEPARPAPLSTTTVDWSTNTERTSGRWRLRPRGHYRAYSGTRLRVCFKFKLEGTTDPASQGARFSLQRSAEKRETPLFWQLSPSRTLHLCFTQKPASDSALLRFEPEDGAGALAWRVPPGAL